MNNLASVSVILASRDRPAYLADALDSLMPQRKYIKEILIFDKSNFPENVARIESIANKYEATLFKRDSMNNVTMLRNEGLAMASGEFMCFLDDDDYLLPNFMESQLSHLQHGASLVFCNYITVRYPQHPIQPDQIVHQYKSLIGARTWTAALAFIHGPLAAQNNAFAFISAFVPIIHGAVIRKDAIDKIRFSEQMVFCEDLHFWILFYKNNLSMAFNKSVLAIYRIHESNFSSYFSIKHNFDFYYSLKNENAVTGKINLFLLKLKLLKFSGWGARLPRGEKIPFWLDLFKYFYLFPVVLIVIPYFITLKYQNHISRKHRVFTS
ncbi:MAG: glycosyltransferase family A protein [Saprospiraceae bacterium]